MQRSMATAMVVQIEPQIINHFVAFFAFPTCHSHLSHGEHIEDGVGEGEEGGDGGPEEGQGEDDQGRHQVHKVIHAQGRHQAKIIDSMSLCISKELFLYKSWPNNFIIYNENYQSISEQQG